MIETLHKPTQSAHGTTTSDTCFEDFLSMEGQVLTHFQAKLTYIGEQRKALPTVVLTAREAGAEDPGSTAAQVLAMRVPGIDFGNDDLAPIFCAATPAELAALLRNLAMLPTVTNAPGAVKYDQAFAGIYLALALYNRVDEQDFRLQSVMGQIEAKALLNAMGRALAGNQSCREALYILWRGLGFHIGPLDPDSDGEGVSDG